ncbi:MAG: 50S ribosomal protein L21 [Candidatus Fischerbacteria bacterium RBG_13_37_8]|uniref:Large ribosomal subunit protein bL21 n=1 Tax=Candidatus Fischerbacteria bacterium RBG_13_37_8 TaxID=1817863 RepID=A0A1F5V997_9BACT|nr:MAG: 50S ribosomal protein L21 [Candidatus Fischerbacteria bacterium RBG_13_37_8]
MFAIIQNGGKQYKIAVGNNIDVEKVTGGPGEKIELKEFILLQTDDGKMLTGKELEKAVAIGTIIEQGKNKKVIIFKKKRRETFRKKTGHRQLYTRVKINDIILKGGDE